MTAPLDLSDDERVMLRVAVLDEDDVTMRLLQKLSDARAALREIQRRTDGVTDIGWDGLNNLRVLLAAALADTTAPVAVPTCAGCAKVARHPGEGYECMAHPSPRMAPDPVQAAYAECAEVAFDAMENYCTCSRPEPKCRTCLALVEAKREIESAAARARGDK